MLIDNLQTHTVTVMEPMTNEEVGMKRKKKQNNDGSKRIKPPTAEELNKLRETENLFLSNMFRLQIDEMLKEVKPKQSTMDKINEWFDKFTVALVQDMDTSCYKKEFLSNVNISEICAPFHLNPLNNIDGTFRFTKPCSTKIVGSYSIGTSLMPLLKVDVSIIMGKSFFNKKDYSDEKYLRKKAFYLHCLAKELIKVPQLIDNDVQFSHDGHSYYSPALIVKPADSLDSNNYSTPYYNSLILQDLVIDENTVLLKEIVDANQNVQDALILLKIWLKQKSLGGIGNITNFILFMYVVYLFKNHKVNKFMSSYQIIRNVWLNFGQSDWLNDGITLVDSDSKKDVKLPIISDFHSAFQVVFVDSSGYLNLCANVFKSNYIHIKNECNFAVEMLDNSKMNSFSCLFLTKASFLQQFDHYINFNDINVIQSIVNQHSSKKLKLDYREDLALQFQKIIEPLLIFSLGDRISDMCFNIFQKSVDIKKIEEPCSNFLIGLKLNSLKANSVVERGPTANLPEAKEFRSFWGEKSQLRRFKDGEVCEAVVWAESKSALSKKRCVTRDIVQYVFSHKLSISPEKFIYIADQAETVLQNPFILPIGFDYGTGEGASLCCIDSFNEVGKTIRQLEGLPLTVNSVQGISPVLRYTDVIPPLSRTHMDSKKKKNTKGNCILAPTEDEIKIALGFIEPIEGVLQFASSGKWPNELNAVKRMITAFYINLAARLNKECHLIAQPFINHIDIMKNGFVFRFRIYYPGQISLLKKEVLPDGMIRYRDTEESLILERSMIQLPTLTSSIHGLHMQYPSYGPTCCLAKRWLRSQLIDNSHFPDICVELIVASYYLQPEPFKVTSQPTIGLLHFLRKLSSTDWFREFIIINFNNDISKDHISTLECTIASQQDYSSRPAMLLVTPYDLDGTSWTKEAPTFTILARLMHLSRNALSTAEESLLNDGSVENLKQIFRPSLHEYDIIITLKNIMNPLRHMAIDAKMAKVYTLEPPNDEEKIPIVGLNPVQELLNILRDCYSKYALFFHDTYGGNVIGIVFKPDVFNATDFKVTNVNGQKLVKSLNSRKQVEFNLDAFIEDIHVHGGFIVKEIEKCNKSLF
ncbi:Hypothetical protein CINCED_3A008556 [Cinara cedri]|uniref:Nucleolar protein 6 n=1 Tax=Cinara cedri TaxID=506608 RepID=A0A5E4NKU9_9HEMI|nr:Hypothetical protein CINCED_3A008556 [Cinara cedri]